MKLTRLVSVVAAGLGMAMLSIPSGAQTFTKLYDLRAQSYERFVADSQGNYYGVFHSNVGGQHGLVFKLSPPSVAGGAWIYSTLWTMPNGTFADGGVVIDSAGVLYGEANTYNVGGIVYKLSPPATSGGAWTDSTLYSFTGPSEGAGTDGFEPYGGLTLDTIGNVYGVTELGGQFANGIAFKLSRLADGSYQETILRDLDGAVGEGHGLRGGMLLSKTGVLYGTSERGGSFDHGAVFRLTPPASGSGTWSDSTLYSFGGTICSTTCEPYGLLAVDGKGTLYGASGYDTGYGSVFSLAQPTNGGTVWAFTTLHTFTGKPDGQYPTAGVIRDPKTGTLYGTTEYGGSAGRGIVFKLTPPTVAGGPWSETILHAFAAGESKNPYAPLVLDSHGVLYGTDINGGTNGTGTFWSLIP